MHKQCGKKNHAKQFSNFFSFFIFMLHPFLCR